jgi:chorismate mutase
VLIMKGGRRPGAGRRPLPILTPEQAAELLERLAADIRAHRDPDELARRVIREAQRIRRSLLREAMRLKLLQPTAGSQT